MGANTSGHPETQHSEQAILNDGFDRDFNVPVSEQLGFDGQNLSRMQADDLAVRYDSAGYIGYAAPGSLTSAAKWQICKLDSSSGVALTYANGSGNYNQVWDNRASLSYS